MSDEHATPGAEGVRKNWPVLQRWAGGADVLLHELVPEIENLSAYVGAKPPFDSRISNYEHIATVREYMLRAVYRLMMRAHDHDLSKLVEPEKSVFDEYTPKLKASSYQSDEYRAFLDGMAEGLRHHYSVNTHHPEHFEKTREWRSVVGYEGFYEVSSLGEVRSLDREIEWNGTTRKLKGKPRIAHINPFGYARLQLGRDGEKQNVFVHVLVAEAFLSPVDGETEVNHKDGNKLNCRAENLEWCTRAENVQHAVDTGLLPSSALYAVTCVEHDITTIGSSKMVHELARRGVDTATAGILRAAETGGTHKGLHFEARRLSEHRASGIHGMDLLDIIEMLCDWKAATLRHDNGDLSESITINRERFGYGDEIERLLRNTARNLGLLD
jgi:hypothetical protein